MALLVIFLALAFVLILFLWGGSMLMQGWLYQGPADWMPVRAAAGGTALAAYLIFWCWLYANNPGKYDTLFEFSSQEVTEYDAFDTVMRSRDGKEVVVHHRRPAGATQFVDGRGQPWSRSSSDRMAVAVLVKEKGKDEPTRFDANLDDKGNFPRDELRFTDKSGRTMSALALGQVTRRKTGLLLGNILLNALHFVLWWVVLWLGMRFSVWHAFGLAFVLWLFVMVAVQPVLFNQVRPKDAPVAWLSEPGSRLARLGEPGYYADARMCMMSPSCTT